MKNRLKNLLANHSLNSVDSMYRHGQIDQLTFEAYKRVWDWIAVRFGGLAGWKQDHFWALHGKHRFTQKVNRTRAAFNLEPIEL